MCWCTILNVWETVDSLGHSSSTATLFHCCFDSVVHVPTNRLSCSCAPHHIISYDVPHHTGQQICNTGLRFMWFMKIWSLVLTRLWPELDSWAATSNSCVYVCAYSWVPVLVLYSSHICSLDHIRNYYRLKYLEKYAVWYW